MGDLTDLCFALIILYYKIYTKLYMYNIILLQDLL